MNKKYRLPKFWKLALAQLALAILLVLVVFYVRTEELLSGPHAGDLYAYTWGFQLVVFSPVLVASNTAGRWHALVMEHQVLKPYYLAQQTENRPNAA